MSAEETIARNVAQRFAAEIGAPLPRAVAVALAAARGEDAHFRSADPAHVAAFAGVVVSAASLVWAILMGQWQQRQAAAAAEQAKPDPAAVKRAIVERLNEDVPHLAALEAGLRARMLSAIVEEALAEAARRDGGAR